MKKGGLRANVSTRTRQFIVDNFDSAMFFTVVPRCKPSGSFSFLKVGDIFIAYPMDDPWAPVCLMVGAFPQDFMAEREQSAWDAVPDREEL